MPRNSEIDRDMLGSAVIGMYEDGKTPLQIASKMSTVGKNDYSKQQVQRYIQNYKRNDSPMLSSVVVDPRTQQLEMLAAAIQGLPDQRDTHSDDTEYYGRFSVNTKNVFDEYYEIARGGLSGQVTRAFINIALKMTNGIRLVTDEPKQDSLNELSNFIKFQSLSQNIARSQVEMGTVVTQLYDVDDNLTVPEISPMNYITLLTEKETVGNIDPKYLIHGTVDKIIHDENGLKPITYERDQVGLFRLWEGTNYFVDIMGRNTFGIYGASMVPEIRTPLKSMLNASYYYDEFVKRYGMGRLHVDMSLLGELLKDGLMKDATAQTAMEKETAAYQKIKANEDIISMGQDISMIETKHGFDITKYLEYRRTEIAMALLQSDVSSGKVGSQFTNSGGEVSKQDLMTYQSLRDTFFDTLLNDVVGPYLPDYGLSIKDVSIVAEPLSVVQVNHRDLLEAEATGNITQGELRQRWGFPEKKPEVAL